MPQSLLDFWENIPGAAHLHPDDSNVLRCAKHSFQLDCLPAPCLGPLRTAPIVLLFLNPGFVDFDLEHAQSIGGQDFYFRQRSGNSELPSKDEHPFAHKWWASRIKHLGVDETKASKNVAIVNISPYKSKGFSDYHMLAALPSSRACLNWAQSELFPSAKSKQRVVICLRSAAYWGLGCASETGFLFIPEVNRGGFMSRNMRPAIQKAISSVAPHLMPLS